MKHYFALLAKELQEKGYDIIPVNKGQKGIFRQGWQDEAARDVDNIDFRTGKKGISHRTVTAPAIDVDVTDAGLANQLCVWLSSKGFKAFRYGSRPKFAVIAQWPDGPQSKQVSNSYDCGKIEILGEGQQIVMFNQHPDGFDYEWTEDLPEVSALPLLTDELVTEMFDFYDSIASTHYMKTADSTATATSNSTPVPQLSEKEITDHLDTLNPDCDYDTWVKTGMGIYHAGGSIDQWVSWSEASDKYPGFDELSKKWLTFDTYHGPKTALIGRALNVDDAMELLSSSLSALTETRIESLASTQFESAHTAYHSETKYDWLIKGFVERDTISMLYGSYGTFKSFVMVDIGMHIAAGRPWLGKHTEKGAVFFLIGEGKNGIKRRIKAWFKYMGIKPGEDFPFYYSVVPANLSDPEKMQELLHVMDKVASAKPTMIVIDTLHKSMPGMNENSAEDMALAINEVEKIKQRHNSSCWVVHHSGKDAGRGARGSSSIPAAMDNSYEVIRESPDEYGVKLRCDKIKDGRKPIDIELEALEINLGEDEDGDPITSLVMTSEVFTPAQRYSRQLGLDGLAAKAYEILFDADQQTMDFHDWRDEIISRSGKEGATARKAFQRAKDLLFERGIIMGETSITLSSKITLFPAAVTSEIE